MELNYILLAITGVLSVTGLTELVKGSAGRINHWRTAGSVIVFILALIATLTGTDYATFKAAIESMLAGR
jgi:hypothetical protein